MLRSDSIAIPMMEEAQSRRRVTISLACAALALTLSVVAWVLSPASWHGEWGDNDWIDQAFDATDRGGDGPPHVGRYCSAATSYGKDTLKSVHDAPVASLLTYAELKGERKFEASDVIRLGEYFYAICDSSWAILRVHETQPLRSKLNAHLGSPTRGFAEGESGFEGIFYDPTDFGLYLVRESVDISGDVVDGDGGDGRRRLGLPAATDDPEYHAVILQVQLPAPDAAESDYEVLDSCPSEYRFDGDSKGFEGAASLRGADGVLYVLGLCEGNSCRSGATGQAVGHGRVVVMRREATGGPTGGCRWKTVRILELPIEHFVDYSALALHKSTGAVAITSQENSQVWIGSLTTGSDGAFDPAAAEFVAEKSKVYDFPRDPSCNVQYCNVEGISWVEGGGDGTPQVLVAVSDKMKSRGRQPFSCLEKDQSFHLFAIP